MQRLLYSLRVALAAPSRNPRMAVVIGRMLASAFLICFGTGLYSHFLQNPLPWMHFATRPETLYQVTQGVHITAGILCFPLIFGKLYAVFPELFQTPPIRSAKHLLERASIALFVAASLMEITIGLLNTFQAYRVFAFPFRQTHYALSFVIIGSLAIHIAVKLDLITKYWRKADAYDSQGEVVDKGEPVPAAASEPLPAVGIGITSRVFAWIDKTPAAAGQRVSRRGFLTAIGVSGATVVALTAGQSFSALNVANIFGPRKNGTGPQGLPVNRTAHAAKVLESARAADWALTVSAAGMSRSFSYQQLQALPQHTVELPIACVEGWSQMAKWRGPRLRDLMDSVGAPAGASVRATSLEQGSIYAVMEMGPEYVRDELTLVALHLDGAPLDIDHGYPARMIAPGRPGVLQTKWLSKVEAIL